MILSGVLIAFATIGIIQWFKNLVDFGKKFSWLYSIIMAVVCVIIAAVKLILPFVFYGLFAFACTQLFYENIIQIVKTLIENIKIGSGDV